MLYARIKKRINKVLGLILNRGYFHMKITSVFIYYGAIADLCNLTKIMRSH